MGIQLSPLEKFRLLKEGKLPPEELTSEPAEGKKKIGAADAPYTDRTPIVGDAISPMDPGGPDDPQGIPHYKKLGEPCSHPKDRWRTERGRAVGSWTVCGDCGRAVKDADLAT